MLTRRSYVTQVKHKTQVTRVKRNERWTQIASTEGKLHAHESNVHTFVERFLQQADPFGLFRCRQDSYYVVQTSKMMHLLWDCGVNYICQRFPWTHFAARL